MYRTHSCLFKIRKESIPDKRIQLTEETMIGKYEGEKADEKIAKAMVLSAVLDDLRDFLVSLVPR